MRPSDGGFCLYNERSLHTLTVRYSMNTSMLMTDSRAIFAPDSDLVIMVSHIHEGSRAVPNVKSSLSITATSSQTLPNFARGNLISAFPLHHFLASLCHSCPFYLTLLPLLSNTLALAIPYLDRWHKPKTRRTLCGSFDDALLSVHCRYQLTTRVLVTHCRVIHEDVSDSERLYLLPPDTLRSLLCRFLKTLTLEDARVLFVSHRRRDIYLPSFGIPQPTSFENFSDRIIFLIQWMCITG